MNERPKFYVSRRPSLRRVYFACFASLCILASNCKPRKSSSKVSGAAEEIASLQARAKEIQQIVAQKELFSGSATMGQGDLTMKSAADQAAQAPSDARAFKMPGGCSDELWKATPEYDAPVFGRLKQSLASPFYDVRVEAFKAIAGIIFSKNLHCGVKVVEGLLESTFKDDAPSKELVRSDTPENVKWHCSNYIKCSFMMDAIFEVMTPMRDSEVLLNLIRQTQKTASSYMDSKISPIVSKLISYRAEHAIAQLTFLRKTRIFTEYSVGRPLNRVDEASMTELRKLFSDLQMIYESEVVERFQGDRYAILVKQEFIKLLTQEIFPDPGNFYKLPPEERKRQEDAAETYLASLPAAVIQSYENIQATALYLERIPQASPLDWLADLKKGVALFKLVRQKQKLLELQGKSISDSELSTLAAQVGTRSDGKPAEAINPRIAIRALSAYFDHEVWLPFRADVIQTANEIYMQIEPSVRVSVLSDLRRMEKSAEKVWGYFSKKSSAMAGLDNVGLNITDKQMAHYNEMRATISRLAMAEPEIARLATAKSENADLPKMYGFNSLVSELQEYTQRMLRRASAQKKYVEFFADDKALPKQFIDHVVSQKTRSEAYRYFFAPGTGSDQLLFDLKREHWALIEQFLVIKCLDRVYGHHLDANALKISERFILEETELTFECKSDWSLSELRRQAFNYARGRSQTEVEQHVWRAVRNSPFLHTAMMVGLSAVVGPASAWMFQSAALSAGVPAVVVQGALMGRNVLMIPKLIVESYVFSVAEWGATKVIDQLGESAGAWGKIQYSAQELKEMSAHSPFTNWEGALTGAIIFGAIPYVHHVGGSLAQNALTKVMAAPSPWLKHVAKGAGEFAGEYAFFRYHHDLTVKADEFWQRLNLNYKDIDAEMELQMRMHNPDGVQQSLSTLITVLGFSANRWGGAGLRQLGTPTSIAGELNYIKLQIKDLKGRSDDKYRNPYEVLGIKRGASEKDIEDAVTENRLYLQVERSLLAKAEVDPESPQFKDLVTSQRLIDASARVLKGGYRLE